MVEKYLKQSGGVLVEMAATQTSSGAGDAGKIVALDDTGKLDMSAMPVGLGAETDIVPASEALFAGAFVNLWDDSGTLKARKADASTSGKEANGFVLAAVSMDDNAVIYRPSQLNTQLTGMPAGSKKYLSISKPGGVQDLPPTGAGQVVQLLGVAKSATELIFNPQIPITLA